MMATYLLARRTGRAFWCFYEFHAQAVQRVNIEMVSGLGKSPKSGFHNSKIQQEDSSSYS